MRLSPRGAILAQISDRRYRRHLSFSQTCGRLAVAGASARHSIGSRSAPRYDRSSGVAGPRSTTELPQRNTDLGRRPAPRPPHSAGAPSLPEYELDGDCQPVGMRL
jgi:hypothetical protein